MVQVLPARKTGVDEFLAGVQRGSQRGSEFAQMVMQNSLKRKANKEEIAQKMEMLNKPEFQQLFKDVDPRLAKIAQLAASGIVEPGVATSMAEMIRQGISDKQFDEVMSRIEGGDTPDIGSIGEMNMGKIGTETAISQLEPQKANTNYDSQIKNLQDALRFANTPQKRSQVESKIEQLQKQKAEQRKTFESERSYHTQFSKGIEEKVEKMRESIPRKESALNLSRNAVETGNVEYFSPDKLADATGIDLFRTSKGAQLITAGKENLLSNMARTSAKAQNIWFEQRLNSMFAKIGQSVEANLTTQEMLEGELAMDKAYQEMYDRMSTQDESEFGFVKKDIDKRVHNAIKDQEKTIFNRTNYRLRELEEQEMGIEKLRDKVGKNAIKGTPLTLSMAKLYKDKFGENALVVAKKNGYYIPTLEEFQSFRERPQEFREGLSE